LLLLNDRLLANPAHKALVSGNPNALEENSKRITF